MGIFFFFFSFSAQCLVCPAAPSRASSQAGEEAGWEGVSLSEEGCLAVGGGLNQGLEPGESASPHRLWPSEPPRLSSRTDPRLLSPWGPDCCGIWGGFRGARGLYGDLLGLLDPRT